MDSYRALAEAFNALATTIVFLAIAGAAIVFGTGIGLLLSAILKSL